MKLYQINIKNFRSFKQLKIQDFKDLNLIVGNNNFGKTSILEAIFLSIGISNPQLAITIDSLRGLFHDESDDFKFIFNELDYSRNIELDSEFVSKSQFRKLIIRPTYSKIKDVNKKELETEDISSASESITRNEIDGIQFEFSVKSLKQSKDRFVKATIQLTSKGAKITTANFKEELLGIFLRPTAIASEAYDRIDKIQRKKGLEKLIKTLKQIDKNIINISLGSKNMVYFDIGIKELIPIQIMGDGIIRLLSILTAIASAENGFVIIDEIENGFHYSFLSRLWESIYETSKQYNVQVFASTHSFECVEAFSKIGSNLLMPEDNIRLIRIEKKSDNNYKVVNYNRENVEDSIDSNWEIR